MKRLLLVLSLVSLMGCATGPSEKVDANYALTIEAQKSIALKQQQPLLRIKAQPGQSINLSGIEEFTVYAPENNNQASNISQYVAPRSEGLEIARTIAGVAAPVLSIWAGGHAAQGLATAVGNASNHGYQYIQAPAANMTIGGNGTIGSGAYNTSTVSTTSTLSGTGTMGAGAFTTNDLVGTGVVGSGTNTNNPVSTTNNTYPALVP